MMIPKGHKHHACIISTIRKTIKVGSDLIELWACFLATCMRLPFRLYKFSIICLEHVPNIYLYACGLLFGEVESWLGFLISWCVVELFFLLLDLVQIIWARSRSIGCFV